jgi:hypothetical protein
MSALPYDPDVARAKLAEYKADLERQKIITTAFYEATEQHQAEEHRLERQIRTLTERMVADGLLPAEPAS